MGGRDLSRRGEGGKKGGGIIHGERQEKSPEGQENEWKSAVAGGGEVGSGGISRKSQSPGNGENFQ